MIWHNGEFKPENTPVLQASDRALRGDGVFDTMLAIDGKPAHAGRHLKRLIDHAKRISIEIEPSGIELETIIDSLIKQNALTDGKHAINTTITRGPSGRGLAISDTSATQIIIRTSAVPDNPPEVRTIIAKNVKRNEQSPLANIKSLNYGDNILAMIEARALNANDAIMLNTKGKVACSTTGNIFVIEGGDLYTPPIEDGAMQGVTRALLMEKYGAKEETLEEDDIKNAEGLFISNAIRGLQPVHNLNGLQLEMQKPDIPDDFHH